jgi:tetratricopeptide (TPR) repeat protein
MKHTRIAGSFMTAGALAALMVSALFGQSGTPVIAQAAASAQASPSAVAKVPSPASPIPAPDLDSVRLFRRAGLTDAAMAELRRWIQQNPKTALPDDIKALLAQMDDNSLALARAYAKVGLRDDATSALQAWIQQHPTEDVPADLRTLLPGFFDHSLHTVRAYKNARLFDAAASELQRWVQQHPDEEVPADLQTLLPTALEGRWWWFRKVILPWGTALLAIATGLAILALLAIRASGYWRPYLVITDFEASDPDASLGKRLATRLRQRLAQPSVATPSLLIATGAVAPEPIPAEIASGLASTAPALQFLAKALKWIRPSKIVTVAGVLHPAGVHGAGITLTVAEGQRVQGSVTIWQQEFEPDFVAIPRGKEPVDTSPAYEVLVPPAETWLRVHMRQQYGATRAASEGPDDWRSEALFKAGLRLNNLGRLTAARTLYLGALARDPENLGSRLNLALLLPSSERREEINQLAWVAEKSKGTPRDTTYYSAAFSLAMALVDDGREPEAAQVAQKLVEEIDSAIARLPRRAGRRSASDVDSSLEDYLRLIGPSARVMAAALNGAALPASVDTSWPTVEFQYNVACYYSMRGDDDSLMRSIEHLEFAAALNTTRVAESAASDVRSVLKKVSASEKTRERFGRIIASVQAGGPPARPRTLLASLDAIGPVRAAALATQQVSTPADLVVVCSVLTRANEMAVALGVEVSTILRWARVAELMRLTTIQPPQVNALVAAGYDSITTLRGVTPTTIAGVLKDWSREPAVAPPADILDAWAIEAASSASLVVATPASAVSRHR